nr:AF-9-like protein [Naematelia aurantialba]
MSNERQRNIQVHRPVIYGSHARLLTDAERELAPPGHTHRWTVFFTSATSPPPSSGPDTLSEDVDYLPGGADDLSYLVKKVTFRLHETYPNPSRVCDKPPFKVTETGWGEFTVQIRIQFVQESGEKPLNFAHTIKLHHWGPPIEAPAPDSASLPPSATPAAPAGAAGAGDDADDKPGTERDKTEDRAVKAEVQTPGPAAVSGEDNTPKHEEATPAPDSASTPAEAPASASASTPAPTRATTAAAAATPTPISATESSLPVSIASKYPVHAWQYDEIVFSDPPLSFLNILNANPPTPLPPRNRRPRDQREEHEIRTGKKGKKALPMPLPLPLPRRSESRQATPAQTPHPGTPVASTQTQAAQGNGTPGPGTGSQTPSRVGAGAGVVGIPGELGSADVPLEFSLEMEKAEWNRLNDARLHIVAEMDRWREKLIAQEKELAKLKEEMKVA